MSMVPRSQVYRLWQSLTPSASPWSHLRVTTKPDALEYSVRHDGQKFASTTELVELCDDAPHHIEDIALWLERRNVECARVA